MAKDLKVFVDSRGLNFVLGDLYYLLTKEELASYIGNNLMLKIVKFYQNGDFSVVYFEDGTKVRVVIDSNVENPQCDFPDSIDMCISKKCDNGCAFCYNNSTPDGNIASHVRPLIWNYKGGEIAFGGGDVFSYYPLLNELLKCRHSNIFASITINQADLTKSTGWYGLEKSRTDCLKEALESKTINGIGISMVRPFTDEEIKIIDELSDIRDTVVIHVINYIFSPKLLDSIKKLKRRKVLILGYKHLGRGVDYISKNTSRLVSNFMWLEEDGGLEELRKCCNLVMTDTLAAQQLNIPNKISDWEHRFQGPEGSCTMYIDAVEHTYGISSIDEQFPYDPKDDKNIVERLFNKLKEK